MKTLEQINKEISVIASRCSEIRGLSKDLVYPDPTLVKLLTEETQLTNILTSLYILRWYLSDDEVTPDLVTM